MMRRVLTSCAVLAIVGAVAAEAGTCPSPIMQISDIQASVDGGGGSLCVGENPSVEGIVYAVYPGANGFAFADAPGAWNGIWVYHPDGPLPAVGDAVTVSGVVQEFNGLTEIALHAGACGGATCTVVVDSQGNVPHAPTVLTTADLRTGAPSAESWEGVFVEVQNVTVSSENPDAPQNFGEIEVDDGSGGLRVDDLGSVCTRFSLGEELAFVRGMHYYSFSNFKIQPRDDCDFGLCSGGPATARTIAALQGTGVRSPFEGDVAETTGTVTGFFEGNYPGGGRYDGFFLQDPVGDGDPATSEGIFVLSSQVPAIGNEVTVSGLVAELNEYDGLDCIEGCMTVLCASSVTDAGAGPVVSPTTFDPPTDPVGELEYHESLEGMQVQIVGPGAVVGPTSFGTIFVTDADLGVERVLRGSDEHGKQVGVRHYGRYGNIPGPAPDDLIVGSTVDSVTGELDGPLMTSYGDVLIATQEGDEWTTVTSVPLPLTLPSWSPPGPSTFTAMSFNLHNLDAGDTTHRSKVVQVLTQAGCPTFVGLQEVDTASTLPGDEDEVLTDLLLDLGAEGCPYDAAFSHPDVGDHGVAVLWRTDLVSDVSWHADIQACSPSGSPSSVLYDDFCDGIEGELPLFARRPVVVLATVDASGCGGFGPMEVALIGNHFKSKLGGAASDQRRLEEAQAVAAAVDALVLGGRENVVVLGDLNDFEDSPPLLALEASGELSNLWTRVPAEERYSYIFGGVSQILDHALASSALEPYVVGVGPLRFNADFPNSYSSSGAHPWGTSDHDPVVATFEACAGALIFADGFESGDTQAW